MKLWLWRLMMVAAVCAAVLVAGAPNGYGG